MRAGAMQTTILLHCIFRARAAENGFSSSISGCWREEGEFLPNKHQKAAQFAIWREVDWCSILWKVVPFGLRQILLP